MAEQENGRSRWRLNGLHYLVLFLLGLSSLVIFATHGFLCALSGNHNLMISIGTDAFLLVAFLGSIWVRRKMRR